MLQALDSLGSGQTKERQPPLSLPSEPSVQFGPAQVNSGKRRGQAEGEGEQARLEGSGRSSYDETGSAHCSMYVYRSVCSSGVCVCACVCVHRRPSQCVCPGTSVRPICEAICVCLHGSQWLWLCACINVCVRMSVYMCVCVLT